MGTLNINGLYELQVKNRDDYVATEKKIAVLQDRIDDNSNHTFARTARMEQELSDLQDQADQTISDYIDNDNELMESIDELSPEQVEPFVELDKAFAEDIAANMPPVPSLPQVQLPTPPIPTPILQHFVACGAKMTCTFAMGGVCVLNVGPDRVSLLAGPPKANIMDFKPLYNIPSFGMCTSMANPQVAAATAAAFGVLTPQPCIPNIVAPWAPGKSNLFVQGHPALLNTDTLQCVWGGVITLLPDPASHCGTAAPSSSLQTPKMSAAFANATPPPPPPPEDSSETESEDGIDADNYATKTKKHFGETLFNKLKWEGGENLAGKVAKSFLKNHPEFTQKVVDLAERNIADLNAKGIARHAFTDDYISELDEQIAREERFKDNAESNAKSARQGANSHAERIEASSNKRATESIENAEIRAQNSEKAGGIIAKNVETDTEAKAKQVETDTEAKAEQVETETETKAKQVETETETKAKQVETETETKAKQVETETEAKAKQVETDAEANAKNAEEKANKKADELKNKRIKKRGQVHSSSMGPKDISVNASRKAKGRNSRFKSDKIRVNRNWYYDKISKVRQEGAIEAARIRAEGQNSAEMIRKKGQYDAEKIRNTGQNEAARIRTQGLRASEEISRQGKKSAEMIRTQGQNSAEMIRTQGKTEAGNIREQSKLSADHIRAQGEADAARIRAEGLSEAERIRTEGEEKAVKSEAKAKEHGDFADRLKTERGKAQKINDNRGKLFKRITPTDSVAEAGQVANEGQAAKSGQSAKAGKSAKPSKLGAVGKKGKAAVVNTGKAVGKAAKKTIIKVATRKGTVVAVGKIAGKAGGVGLGAAISILQFQFEDTSQYAQSANEAWARWNQAEKEGRASTIAEKMMLYADVVGGYYRDCGLGSVADFANFTVRGYGELGLLGEKLADDVYNSPDSLEEFYDQYDPNAQREWRLNDFHEKIMEDGVTSANFVGAAVKDLTGSKVAGDIVNATLRIGPAVVYGAGEMGEGIGEWFAETSVGKKLAKWFI